LRCASVVRDSFDKEFPRVARRNLDGIYIRRGVISELT
jgi:hypothetical protein